MTRMLFAMCEGALKNIVLRVEGVFIIDNTWSDGENAFGGVGEEKLCFARFTFRVFSEHIFVIFKVDAR